MRRVVLWNLPFALAMLVIDYLPAFVKMLLVGSILLLLPGLAWVNRNKEDGFSTIFKAFVISIFAGTVVLIILNLILIPVDRVFYLLFLTVFTNIGLVIGRNRNWYVPININKSIWVPLLIVAGIFYAQTYIGAAYRVPPLVDHDIETQGTAYGLINHFKPTMVTDRDSVLFFAHPILLHILIGQSALISGDIERLRYYHESSITNLDSSSEALTKVWKKNVKRFFHDPVLLPTRTPNLFFAALTLLPMGLIMFGLSGSRVAAIGSCCIYMTLPEIYVRSAYGGYLAITNFFLMSTAYFYLVGAGLTANVKGKSVDTGSFRYYNFLSGFLGAWANQKCHMIVAAAAIHASLGVLITGPLKHLWNRVRRSQSLNYSFLLVAGSLCGWGLYIFYGMTISTEEFIRDHIYGHFLDRIGLNKDLPTTQSRYPGIPGLWYQFAVHAGWLIVGPAIISTAWASKRFQYAEGLLLTWVIIGAVVFSITDWRQTKHLSLILPPLAMLIGLFWSSLSGRPKTLLTLLLGLGIAWNIWQIGLLMFDFSYISPTPDW